MHFTHRRIALRHAEEMKRKKTRKHSLEKHSLDKSNNNNNQHISFVTSNVTDRQRGTTQRAVVAGDVRAAHVDASVDRADVVVVAVGRVNTVALIDAAATYAILYTRHKFAKQRFNLDLIPKKIKYKKSLSQRLPRRKFRSSCNCCQSSMLHCAVARQSADTSLKHRRTVIEHNHRRERERKKEQTMKIRENNKTP